VDNPLLLKQAQLTSARANLRILQARGSIDLLRMRLAKLTGLPAASVESVPESVPALPEIKQEDDLGSKAVDYSPAVRAADIHAQALTFRARGEHRALWPTLDFAAQYALLSTFNNYENFFRANSFQPNNATIGVVFRFPLLNFSQFAHARAADAEALHSKKQAEATRNQVSEETLRLQRSVAQLAAAQEVASLEYDIAQSNFEAVQVRIDAGTATLRESADANSQAGDRFNALQDANFELQKTRIALLRATGDLESWIGLSK
jgi:outer membrane protein TolC